VPNWSLTRRRILRPPLVAVVVFGVEVKALYVDEAGCLGAIPSATSDIQPVFVIAGVCFDISHLPDLTRDFIALKRRFFPSSHTSSHQLDAILVEVKGADIRRNVSSGGRSSQRAAFGFLDKVLDLIEQNKGQAFGRIWVKGIGAQFKAREIYSSSIQSICTTFQASLHATGEPGIVVLDSRNKQCNTNVSHSIFTKKFQAIGDEFPRLLEMPLFGHSDNHAGIQIADLVCSALLFPIAIQTYCTGHIANVHVRDYTALKTRYITRLQQLQFRYQDPNGKWRGGFTVADAIVKRSGAELFR
jgi:hypothetical protein